MYYFRCFLVTVCRFVVAGERRRLWIPSALAYGDAPPAGFPAGGLIFDVELLAVQRSNGPALGSKMSGFRADPKKTVTAFKSPWAFLDKFIP